MNLQEIDPKEIKWPEVRMTSYFTDEQMEQFRGSVEAMGQVEPILVLKTDDGFVGIDGYNRTMDAVSRELPSIAAVVTEGEEYELYTKNLATAFMRGRPKPTELIKVVRELTKTYEMDSDEIAGKTGMTRDYVEKLWVVAETDPEILNALDADRIGFTAAQILARYPDPEGRIRLLDMQLMYNWTIGQLQEHGNGAMEILGSSPEPVAPSEPRAPVLVACGFCGSSQPPERVAHPPTCMECADALHQAIRAERQA